MQLQCYWLQCKIVLCCTWYELVKSFSFCVLFFTWFDQKMKKTDGRLTSWNWDGCSLWVISPFRMKWAGWCGSEEKRWHNHVILMITNVVRQLVCLFVETYIRTTASHSTGHWSEYRWTIIKTREGCTDARFRCCWSGVLSKVGGWVRNSSLYSFTHFIFVIAFILHIKMSKTCGLASSLSFLRKDSKKFCLRNALHTITN